MTPEEAGTLFAVMSLLSGISGAGLLAFIAASRNSESLAEKLLELRNEHSQGALFLAGFVALILHDGKPIPIRYRQLHPVPNYVGIRE